MNNFHLTKTLQFPSYLNLFTSNENDILDEAFTQTNNIPEDRKDYSATKVLYNLVSLYPETAYFRVKALVRKFDKSSSDKNKILLIINTYKYAFQYLLISKYPDEVKEIVDLVDSLDKSIS